MPKNKASSISIRVQPKKLTALEKPFFETKKGTNGHVSFVCTLCNARLDYDSHFYEHISTLGHR